MGLILNIETATTNCSVSLSQDGEILVFREDNNKNYSHAEKLHVFIDELFRESKLLPSNLDAIAVSKGPGSYTGLRIGVSTAKGLCVALDKPLISVSTLEILGRNVNIDEGLIVPMLDARRMEAYTAIFDFNFNEVRDIKAEIINELSFAKELDNNKVYFIGSAVDKIEPLIKHENAFFLGNYFPSSKTMGEISNIKFKKSDFEDVAYFEPYYLKDFVAIKPKS